MLGLVPKKDTISPAESLADRSREELPVVTTIQKTAPENSKEGEALTQPCSQAPTVIHEFSHAPLPPTIALPPSHLS